MHLESSKFLAQGLASLTHEKVSVDMPIVEISGIDGTFSPFQSICSEVHNKTVSPCAALLVNTVLTP